jgi:GNAT superfamily N-acetyltransferase
VGLARVVTDYATFAWLCDVLVDETYRGRGIGKMLVAAALGHPNLAGMRRWLLATRDAHELYRAFGFKELASPQRWMELYDPSK